MRTKSPLTFKLLAMGGGFLLVAMASIGLTLWVAWQLEGGAAAVNEAGRLRMNMLRMVLVQQTESPEDVQMHARQFDASLELLRTGDPSRPLFVPWGRIRGHDSKKSAPAGRHCTRSGRLAWRRTAPAPWPRPTALCRRWTALSRP